LVGKEIKALWTTIFHDMVDEDDSPEGMSSRLAQCCPLLKVAFEGKELTMLVTIIDIWNSTVGRIEDVNYPEELMPLLKSLNFSCVLRHAKQLDGEAVQAPGRLPPTARWLLQEIVDLSPRHRFIVLVRVVSEQTQNHSCC
jgi:hypothetical protein